MIVYSADEVPQGTKRWLTLRMGIPTSSCFDKIMTTGARDWDGGSKGAPTASSQATHYMNHLLAERIVGHSIDGFQSQWMVRGNEFESRAVASYELSQGCDTEKVGFVTTDDGMIGCSPDRLIVGESRGLLECKAPSPAIHVSYLLAQTGAAHEYKLQLQGQLWICERDWVDIISYCPDMPDALFRVNRDEVFIKEMAARVRAFSCQLEERAEDFKSRGWIKPPAAEYIGPLDITGSIGGLGITDEDLSWMVKGVHYE